MAHRLLVRRIWTSSLKDIRCLPASTAATASSSSFSTSLQSATSRVSFLSPSRTLPRSLPHTTRREVSFNVQDHDDFTDRVIKSELPVLVDFHAQSEGRMVHEMDPRFGVASAVVRALHRTVMVKGELSQKAKLWIYWSIYVPTLTYGHELWVVTERMRWCGPCKILGPRLEKAVAKQKGRVAMAKVDIDDHTDLAIEYGVSAVPTVIAIRGGDVVDHFVGIKDDDELDSFVTKIIGQ